MGTLGEEVTFSINTYGCDGEICEEGIFLHFGESRVKVAEGIDEYKRFLSRLNGMTDEIESTASWAL